jgi:hypothetical protein
LKPNQKGNSSVWIITITLLASSIPIALFIAPVVGFGAITQVPPLLTMTGKLTNDAGSIQESLDVSNPLPFTNAFSYSYTSQKLGVPKHEQASLNSASGQSSLVYDVTVIN